MSEIVSMIEEEIGNRLEIKIVPELLRPTNEKIIVGDITKIKRDTGWS